jgi:hypothetical protein
MYPSGIHPRDDIKCSVLCALTPQKDRVLGSQVVINFLIIKFSQVNFASQCHQHNQRWYFYQCLTTEPLNKGAPQQGPCLLVGQGQPYKKTYFLVGRESLLGMFNPAMVAICELQNERLLLLWLLSLDKA